MENTSKQIKERNSLGLINTYRSAIMGFAALWILLHHEWLILAPEGTILHQIGKYITRTGFVGVDIFLLLSGMGLYYAIQKHDLKTFYKRRYIRILPAFLLFALVVAIGDKWTLTEFFGNVTIINFYTKSIHSFSWYAIAIMQLYLVFPLYYKLFNKAKSKSRFTAIVILIWFVISIKYCDTNRMDIYQFTNRIPIFVIGTFFGWMEQNKKLEFNKYQWMNCIVTLVTGLIIMYFILFKIGIGGGIFLVISSHFTLPAILISISGTLLLAKLFELMNTYLRKVGQSIIKLFSLVGSVSFELYVVQQWVGDKIQQKMIGNYSSIVTNIVDLSAVAIACIALVLASKFIIKLFSNEKKK